MSDSTILNSVQDKLKNMDETRQKRIFDKVREHHQWINHRELYERNEQRKGGVKINE